MQLKSLIICSVILLRLGLSNLEAQDNMNTSGGNAEGNGGTESYSIGQVVCHTYTGTNGSSAEGVQQPYEISNILSIEEKPGISLLATAFPNPANEGLTLQINEPVISDLSYQLLDFHGRILLSERITDNQTSIGMSNRVPATYFLKVTQGYKEIKTFKIIKN